MIDPYPNKVMRLSSNLDVLVTHLIVALITLVRVTSLEAADLALVICITR